MAIQTSSFKQPRNSGPSPVTTIALTGGTGFLGSALVARALSAGTPLRLLDRAAIGDLDGRPISPATLDGCALLIHAAARAHRPRESAAHAEAAYHAVNVAGTRALLAAALDAGVPRLIYISSIKACGESHPPGQPLRPEDPARPLDAYGRSKAAAESLLLDAHRQGRIRVRILRPPLIHGPGARGNLRRLLRALDAGLPLPLGGVDNRRSLLGLDNAVDAIWHLARAPGAASVWDRQDAPIWHLADSGAVSSRRLAEHLAAGMEVRPRFFRLPRGLAVAGATLLGRGDAARRLFDDLEVDASAFARDTGWTPRHDLYEGLQAVGRAWRQRGGW